MVLNPGTPIDAIDNLIDLVDLVLIMSVNPGFGGQSFIESQLAKIEAARQRIDADPAATSRWKSMAASRRIPPGAPSPPAPTMLVAGTAVFQGRRGAICRQHRALPGLTVQKNPKAPLPPLSLLPEIMARCCGGCWRPCGALWRRELVLSPPAQGPHGRPYRFHPHDALPRKLEDADALLRGRFRFHGRC